MSQALSSLPQEVVDQITAQTVAEDHQQHMPITVFGDEMNQKAALLKEHGPVYQEVLRFDAGPLSEEIGQVAGALLLQEDIWKKKEIARDSDTRFWYSEKGSLYKLNNELSFRLNFDFKRLKKSDALAVITQIGTSDNDGDAIDDGRRFKILLNEHRDEITVYNADEIDEMIAFFDRIETARNSAQVDRTSPHEDRILRDKIYLYLRELEEQVYEAADAAFVHDAKERSRYVSAYIRRRNQKYRNKFEN